jgi:2-oxoisovalerate dehydrogenase E1 component
MNDEYILPMHRNLGVFTTRGMPFQKLFAQWQGKATGYSKGRERSFHFGSQEHKVVGMISHLGPQMGIADGIALAHKLKKENRCTIVFTGDGATSEGDFHESVNVAAVWDLPVLFIIENNGYGLSTPSSEQFRMKSFTDKAIGYGIEAVQIAGNNILEVYNNLAKLGRQHPREPASDPGGVHDLPHAWPRGSQRHQVRAQGTVRDLGQEGPRDELRERGC